ncbi:two-component sensor histidine kinase [Gracilibacillus boraciitolerans JCM 21714]|uniref:Two-component sensor histidine kinase n=2 Tax=Gracilibacillus boraciitolerans TaxID=307521 RepID=W4VF62_9BACI|nr:two-component sensor histidine kinase [Gracilibacillus boraciitolerans JCM 21714]
MQAQINPPHFLYNTLDTIIWLAEAKEHQSVIELTKALSQYSRISLNKGKDWITIADEIAHIDSYLYIQKTRYEDVLDVSVQVDSNIFNYHILKLLLQPIVENAIYHGIKNKRGKGFLRINGTIEGQDRIRFEVVDNGIGMDEIRLEKLRSHLINGEVIPETKNGFGLINVQQRIQLYYGKEYGLKINSWKGSGTRVTITIPKLGGETEKMKKIFLVDDEAVIRRGISQKIEWEKEGFIYCGDASDGEMALPLIEKHQPDIVITDIKMPFMDGLTLSKNIKEKMPATKIIILSGHDEFEYAQQAIRLQVEEYCLKPVSSEDLLMILRKVKIEMDSKPVFFTPPLETKEDFYELLCKGSLSTEEILYQVKSLQVDLMASYYVVFVIENNNKTMELLHLFEQYQPLYFIKNTKWVIILKHDAEHMLIEQITKIREQLSPILFGIGSIETRTEHITLSYENAIEAYSYSRAIQAYTSSVFLQKNDVIHQDLMKAADRRKLIQFLKFGHREQISRFIPQYAEVILNKKKLSNIFIYYFLLDFTITIRHHMEETEQYNVDIVQTVHHAETDIHQVKTKDQMIDYMNKMLQPLFLDKDTSKYGKVIHQVKQVISESYQDSSLSLQQIASEVNISAAYLSSIFSKEMKQTITEFFNKKKNCKGEGIVRSDK